MAYYNEPSWPAPGRQASWEQPQPPSRSGMRIDENTGTGTSNNTSTGASSTVNSFEANAFIAQFDGTSPPHTLVHADVNALFVGL